MAEPKKRSTSKTKPPQRDRSSRARKAQEAAQQKEEESRQKATKAQAEDSGKESQQDPEEDSNLQTPQPDQPHPTETERREQERRKDDRQSEPQPQESPDEQPEQQDPEEAYEGVNLRADVRREGSEIVDLQVQREMELEAQRREHNERTGGGPVEEGETIVARAEHFKRTDPDAFDAYRSQLESTSAPV